MIGLLQPCGKDLWPLFGTHLTRERTRARVCLDSLNPRVCALRHTGKEGVVGGHGEGELGIHHTHQCYSN